MSELSDSILTEKFRPKVFEDLILEDKSKILALLDNPRTVPSFIFYSAQPGTGKTSCAKVIINKLDCDALVINSSDERGIDVIREKVNRFSMGLSSGDTKRCIFLDEADGLTSQAQNSLRNLMETYSSNCFFIFSCNDISKIIDPIKSRCILINFDNPNKAHILSKLSWIRFQENAVDLISDNDLENLVNLYYPDVRSMINNIQDWVLTKTSPIAYKEDFKYFLDAIQRKDMDYIINATYSGKFNFMAWNRWFFKQIFNEYERLGSEKCIEIAELLADTEKCYNMGVNLEIVFLTNVSKLVKIYESV
jgi:DNA polymerase III delta prime subunit